MKLTVSNNDWKFTKIYFLHYDKPIHNLETYLKMYNTQTSYVLHSRQNVNLNGNLY